MCIERESIRPANGNLPYGRGYLKRPLSAIVVVTAAQMLVSGCSNNEMGFFSREGPNEFSVVPTEQLELPEAFPQQVSDLPRPAPGATNRVDVSPVADVTSAFGGTVGSQGGNEVPGGELHFVRAAARLGMDEDIRRDLLAADRAHRSEYRARPLEIVLGTSIYYRIYEDVTLDAYVELARLRNAGVTTPVAPPRAEESDGNSPFVFPKLIDQRRGNAVGRLGRRQVSGCWRHHEHAGSRTVPTSVPALAIG